jgi:hypothetical protein
MALYFVANGPMPTTAAQAVVTTGTAIKTLLQLKLGGSTNMIGKVVEWGISLDGAAASTIKCELLTTGTVAATITEFVAADVINLTDPNAGAVTDDFPLAFTAAGDESGYTATAEGTITATRMFDPQILVTGTTFGAQYVKQYPLGREPAWKAADFLRVRVTATVAVNAYCYVMFEV